MNALLDGLRAQAIAVTEARAVDQICASLATGTRIQPHVRAVTGGGAPAPAAEPYAAWSDFDDTWDDYTGWVEKGVVLAVQHSEPCPKCGERLHPRQLSHSCRGVIVFRDGVYVCGVCANLNHPDNDVCFAYHGGCQGRREDRVPRPDLSATGPAAKGAQYAAAYRAARGKGGKGTGNGGKGGGTGGGGQGKGNGGKGRAVGGRSSDYGGSFPQTHKTLAADPHQRGRWKHARGAGSFADSRVAAPRDARLRPAGGPPARVDECSVAVVASPPAGS
jgi:hypothetical protein